MRIDGAVFDFDGTLMDTEPAIMASFEHVFELYRTVEEFTPDRRIKVLGPPLDRMMAEFFPEQDPWECVEQYRKYQREHLRDLIRPMSGAIEMLDRLAELKIPCAVVSTRYYLSLKELMDRHDMSRYMTVVLGNDSVRNPKPDPEGILLAKEKLGAEEIFYVGDSVMDVEAGRNAGAYTIAYPSNEGKKAALIASGPDLVIYDLRDLPAVLSERK